MVARAASAAKRCTARVNAGAALAAAGNGLSSTDAQLEMAERGMEGRIEAWQCIGCGRIEAPQNCIGVCQDRKVELVDARSFDELQRRLDAEHVRSGRLLALVQQLAWSKPRPDAWERSYRALQAQARALVEEIRKQTQQAEPVARVVRLDA
jgi:hypothetical protein